jgi:two-component system sensor histidine kinase/response regulator
MMSVTLEQPTELNFQECSILIVDDNPTNLEVLLTYLESCGFELVVARDGESAVKRAQYAHPDIILLDVVMPETDGFEICQRLKTLESTKDIPVIFITALASPDNRIKGFEVGGVDYVTKPIQHEEVFARVTTHLRIRKLQQQLEAQNTLLQEKNVQLQREITERKRAEEQLKDLNQQLIEANASKDRLFSIISHDLRGPFTALLGFSETVIKYIDEYSKEKIKESMSRIRTTSEAIYTLLENLLAWSRLQQGMMEYYPTDIDLAEVVEDSIYLFQPSTEQKQIALRNGVQKGTAAYADGNMIDTVLRNLISNALKFTHAGDTIDISATQTGDYIEIAVTDTGIGISQEDIPKLFRTDSQYTNVGTAGEKGTGLGLSLCKDLIERNGGTIWVESEVGTGTTFKFTLPRSVKMQF